MDYHDELLEHAHLLVRQAPESQPQASLRRAVSAAYYALFHLLISDAVANWSQVDLRASLGRAFDHRIMVAASNRILSGDRDRFQGVSRQVVADLKTVAKSFVDLQEQRHIADYDNTTIWTKTDALAKVEFAEKAFSVWQSIRDQPASQEYLLSLLVTPRKK